MVDERRKDGCCRLLLLLDGGRKCLKSFKCSTTTTITRWRGSLLCEIMSRQIVSGDRLKMLLATVKSDTAFLLLLPASS